MRMKIVATFTALIVGLTAVAGTAAAQGAKGGKKGPAPPAMRLTSSAWPDGAEVPAKYSALGGSTSPALEWTNVPPGTQTFALLFHDPDVSLQKKLDDVTHWIVWN